MKNKLVAKISKTIDANPSEVWKTITTPALIKKYLYGTEVITDWQVGHAIEYKGSYNGKEYHDKGKIIKIEPGKIFESTYWSSMGGKEDKPENYNQVSYLLTEKGDQTILTLTQDNIGSEKERDAMVANWTKVLDKLKEVTENQFSSRPL